MQLLLLCSKLGDPGSRPLTCKQYHGLRKVIPEIEEYDMVCALQNADLPALGFTDLTIRYLGSLLCRQGQLHEYLEDGRRNGCMPLTRLDTVWFPAICSVKLKEEAPPYLWCKGNPRLLATPTVSLVGSRDISIPNAMFAREVGYQAAVHHFTLVSGGARGADRIAQEACLNAGGNVICVVPDELCRYPKQDRVLYLSEEGFREPFSARRALSRNRLIHILGEVTFVAQCADGKGGTWDGTVKNLENKWSPVLCLNDGSPAAEKLRAKGARLITPEQIPDIL